MTLEQKQLLEPFGKMFADMDFMVRAMSDETLKQALAACYAASVTNCWCCTFAAAQYLQREIRTEIHQRKQRVAALVSQ
jgi:hypothetical protein